MIRSFGHNHLRQQAGSSRALLDRLRRLGRRFHGAGTRVFLADVLDDGQLRRNVFVARMLSEPICVDDGLLPDPIRSTPSSNLAVAQEDLSAPTRHVSERFRDAGYYTCNLQLPPEKRSGGMHGTGGSGKVDLNFLLNGPDKKEFFDGIDWNQRKPNQPFFAHITIIETHKGDGWKIAVGNPSPNWSIRTS
jgi:hypothetical protein